MVQVGSKLGDEVLVEPRSVDGNGMERSRTLIDDAQEDRPGVSWPHRSRQQFIHTDVSECILYSWECAHLSV